MILLEFHTKHFRHGLLASRLRRQPALESEVIVGNTVTAVHVCCATAIGMFAPFPTEQCSMNETSRVALETLEEPTGGALDPILLAHRQLMYERYLALPRRLWHLFKSGGGGDRAEAAWDSWSSHAVGLAPPIGPV